jgi:CDGSH-type Zn-finger protein
MGQPVIADRKPAVSKLAAGTYYWCSCGQSTNQPFCNGAHKGTEFTPVAVELTEEKTVALCLCKHSGNGAFCDGSHAKI